MCALPFLQMLRLRCRADRPAQHLRQRDSRLLCVRELQASARVTGSAVPLQVSVHGCMDGKSMNIAIRSIRSTVLCALACRAVSKLDLVSATSVSVNGITSQRFGDDRLSWLTEYICNGKAQFQGLSHLCDLILACFCRRRS
jgi:hypothetical protein